MSEKSHVISTLVEHKPGVLQNVAGLLNRRGFNIDSITVEKNEFIPMFPPGGGINDLLGEYKYESDVQVDYVDEKEQFVEGGK